MPITSTSQPTLIPPTQASFGSPLKEFANQFRYASAQSSDAKLWTALAEALTTAQRQFDSITGVLRGPIPQSDPLQVTAPDGSVVCQIGSILDLSINKSYSGEWVNQFYAAGSGPSTAIFSVEGTNVTIGQNGQVLVLDPYGNAGAWLGAQSEATHSVSGAVNDGTGQIKLTVTAHGFRAGDWVNVANVGGVTNATGQWVISVPDTNHIVLLGSTFSGTYTSGGTVNRFFGGAAFETLAVAAGQRITGVVNNGSGLIRLTIPGHGYSTGYAINTTGIQGVPGANSAFIVTVIDANTVDLQGSTFSGSWTGGGISINWPTAKLLAQGDGELLINNAKITLVNGSAEIILDPSIPEFSLTNGTFTIAMDPTDGFLYTDTGVLVQILKATDGGSYTGGLRVSASVGSNQYSSISPGALYLSGSSGVSGVTANLSNSQLQIFGGLSGLGMILNGTQLTTIKNGQPIILNPNGSTIQLFNDSPAITLTDLGGQLTISAGGSNQNLVLTPSGTGKVSVSSDVDVSGVYRKGGVAGISPSRNRVTAVTTAANGVFGTPGAGQSNGTVVTGVTIVTDTFSGGILTA